MLKNRSFWIVLGLAVLSVSMLYACIDKYRAKQSKMYHECVQDWVDAGATQEEAGLQCDMLLE